MFYVIIKEFLWIGRNDLSLQEWCRAETTGISFINAFFKYVRNSVSESAHMEDKCVAPEGDARIGCPGRVSSPSDPWERRPRGNRRVDPLRSTTKTRSGSSEGVFDASPPCPRGALRIRRAMTHRHYSQLMNNLAASQRNTHQDAVW